MILLLRPLLPDLGRWRDVLFLGWFGPVAMAATYYAALAEHRLGEPVVWHAVSLVVCASVVAHGLSAVPLTRRYRRTAERAEAPKARLPDRRAPSGCGQPSVPSGGF